MSSFFYKIKIAPSEILRTKVDEGRIMRTYGITGGMKLKGFALMQDNPSSFIYGCGYGSLVNKVLGTLSKDAKGMIYF
jgi:hypothetical protein